MVNINIDGSTAIFEVEGWDKLWSFKSRLEIPVAHIRNAYRDPNCTIEWFDSLKLMGTSVPYIFRAGTFYQQGDLVFWDVHNVENTIVVELDHEHFAKLIIEVADPISTINLLNYTINKSNS